MSGKVYIVGAGPGDTGLLTVRGAEVLSKADVVIYDRLANPRLIDLHARRDAERVYVGKASSRHTLPQAEINDLLVRESRAGKTVVRLHGGDPFVFGRGGEEACVLADAGVPFEIVPGVTSAIAAPAYAGIPVTHRGLSTSLAVVTAHEDPSKPESSVDWDKLATGASTLVVLMGVENLPAIVKLLEEKGLRPDTAVAVIRWGTWPGQEVLTGTLGDIVARVAAAGFRPPAVVLVGPVVSLRDRLRWWDNRPLSGKRVLVTRTREQASALSQLLEVHGADPVEAPVLAIAPPITYELLDSALGRLAGCDWVVFTSANGVRVVLERLEALGMDVRAFGRARIAAIGPATAGELQRRSLRADLVPEEYLAEEVAASLVATGIEGKQVMLLTADIARDVLKEELQKAGALVESVVAYRTVPANVELTAVASELLEGKIDIVTLASSSSARYLVAGLGANALNLLSRPLVACIGPATAATARQLGLKVDIEAEEHTIPGLVDAIVRRVT